MCVVLSSVTAAGQEEPKIGLSLGKHVGAVRSKSVSRSDGLIATVSEDRTLKIWEYPSATFKRSINMPEAKGNASRLGRCRFVNGDIVLVANDSGYDYEIRQSKESDRKAKPWPHVSTTYGFYAVDWQNGVIVDRVDGLPAQVRDFVLSPGRDLLLVTTTGDACALYDAQSLRCVSLFTFPGETVLSAAFVGNREIAIVTDHKYYRFEITRYSNVHFAERKQVLSEPLGGTDRRKVNQAIFSDDVRYVYLFSREGFLCALETATGVRRDDIVPDGYHAIVRRNDYSDSLSIFLQGKETIVPTSERDKKSFDRIFGKYHVIYTLAPTPEDLLPDSLFLYRMSPAPVVSVTPDGFDIQYEGRGIWHFDKDRLLMPSLGKDGKLPRPKRYERRGIVENSADWIRFHLPHEDYAHALVYLNDQDEIPALKSYVLQEGARPFQTLLPAEADGIYRWVNENHILVSLKDGTLRWYNTWTGDEELALFLADDGQWILWMPDGKYRPSVPEAANMIEWRYQTLSKIETRKPMDHRRAFYIPGNVEKIVAQLYDDGIRTPDISRIGSLDRILRIDDVEENPGSGYTVRYSLVGFDPVRYGSYTLTPVLDGTVCPDQDYVHYPSGGGGEVWINSDHEVQVIELRVSTDVGDMVPEPFLLSVRAFDEVYVTSVGVADYASVLFPALMGPINDARDAADLLARPEMFGGAKKDPPKVLFNRDVTEAALYDRLSEVDEEAGRRDLAVFYFSGHGVAVDSTFCFILADGSRFDMNRFASACTELACPVLFIVDACYAGLMTGGPWEKIAVLASSDRDSKSVDSRDQYTRSRFTDGLIRAVDDHILNRRSLTLGGLYEQLMSGSRDVAGPEYKGLSYDIKLLSYDE